MANKKKDNLKEIDPLWQLVFKLENQRHELLQDMGEFEIRQEILQNELKDIETQINCLNYISDALEELHNRIFERDGAPD